MQPCQCSLANFVQIVTCSQQMYHGNLVLYGIKAAHPRAAPLGFMPLLFHITPRVILYPVYIPSLLTDSANSAPILNRYWLLNTNSPVVTSFVSTLSLSASIVSTKAFSGHIGALTITCKEICWTSPRAVVHSTFCLLVCWTTCCGTWVCCTLHWVKALLRVCSP